MQEDSAYAAKLEEKLKAFAMSPTAARWVMKALHPVNGPPEQMPDAVQVASLVPEYKLTTTISCPSSLVGGNWDLCVVSIPSDTTPVIWSIGPAGFDFRGTTTATAVGFLQNSPAVLTLGTPYQAFVTSSGAQISVGGYLSSELPADWRTVAKSVTAYSVGSDLYNQGTVYAGQYSRQILPGHTGSSINLSGTSYPFGASTVEVPLHEADMAIMTPDMYIAPAKEGVYSVTRLSGPAQGFAPKKQVFTWFDPVANAYVNSFPGNTGRGMSPTAQTICFRMTGGSADTEIISQALPYGYLNSSVNYISTSYDTNASFGVTIFRGLHPSQSICLKCFNTLEMVPSVFSPSRQFVRPPCRYEPTAMTAYHAIAAEVPTCVAARYNLFGTLLPILSSVASKILPFLAPALKAGGGVLVDTVANAISKRRPIPEVDAPRAPAIPAPVVRVARAAPMRVRTSRPRKIVRRRRPPVVRRKRR